MPWGLTAYAWPAGRSKQVAYFDGAGHVHELYVAVDGSWQHANLTAATGAPAGISGLYGFPWAEEGTKQLVYVDRSGNVHELYVAVGTS